MRLRRLTALALTLGVAGAGVAPVPAYADSTRDRQWHLQFLNVGAAQKISQGDGVVVAVMDTGVEVEAPELKDAVTAGITTAADQTGDGRADGNGHGTAMASLIAARGKGPNDGMLGIAPKSKILPVRVTLSGVAGAPAFLARGIEWAIDHGAKVMSISLVASEDQEVKAAIERAIRSDIVVVAGVGNTPKDTSVGFPANLPGVLAVGGVDQQGNHASVSVTGPEVAISAPAVEMVGIGLDSRYLIADGTSAATAVTAGAVALVRAKYPQLSATEVIHRLTYTAQDKGAPGRDPEYGYGVLDIVKALTADVPPAATSAAPSTASATPATARTQAAEDSAFDNPLLVLGGCCLLVVLAAAGVVVFIVRRRRR